MTQWLKNCWYAAAWADELGNDDRLARTIVSEPILIWRNREGEPRAVEDRCAHRCAPLSKGSIAGDVVRCGYHGVAYDGKTGNCVDNPHGPIVSALAVKPYPVVERHKILWIWIGNADLVDQAAIPDLSFIDRTPRHAFSKGYMPTKADHRLLEDNILDLSHGDYLHAETLGGGSFTRAKPRVEEIDDMVQVTWIARDEKAIPIWRSELPDPDMLVNMETMVRWHPNGVMLLTTDLEPIGRSDRAIKSTAAHIMTPESAFSTHYLYCNSRNYRVDDEKYNAMFTESLAIAFGAEDKPMIEAQQMRVGESDIFDCSPVMLSIDNASTRARRTYKRLVDAMFGPI